MESNHYLKTIFKLRAQADFKKLQNKNFAAKRQEISLER